MNRRSLLQGLIAAPFAASSSVRLTRAAEDRMDEALIRLARTGPEYAGGLANHAPMAAEALCALGREDSVSAWLDGYAPRLDAAPSGRVIAADAWRDALGRPDRTGDWIAFFTARVQEAPWTGVLDEWTNTLAPGIVAAAFHGVIRTAHAARSLGRRDNPLRRRELAHGLAYWAAQYKTLPERTSARVFQTVDQALSEVRVVPPASQRHGLITNRLAPVEAMDAFREVADWLPKQTPQASLSAMGETFARLFWRERDNRRALIGLIHTVTGPGSARLLLPHVSAPTAARLVHYAWQGAAAIHASHSARPYEPERPEAAGTTPGIAALVDRAVSNGDEHAIKFTEACLRENAARPQPIFLIAASDAISRL